MIDDTLTDDQLLEVLALYQRGFEAHEIADLLEVPESDVDAALALDAEEFPNDPLRVLH